MKEFKKLSVLSTAKIIKMKNKYKMKKIVLVVLVTFFAFSCSSEPKKESKPIVIENVEETIKEFIVKMDFKTNSEDSFRLELTNIVIDEFQKKNILVIESVSPSSSYEKITANFGENMSKAFKINFGTKELKEVEITKINLTYGKNSINIKGSELKKYFSISKFIQYDSISGKLKTQKVEGKHYPIITLKRNYINALTQE